MPASEMVKLDPPIVSGNRLPLCIGGPVEPERGWILLAEEPTGPEYRTICTGVYLSTSPSILRAVLSAKPEPRARVLAGYAGWGPGQLDYELAQSAWLMADVAIDLVFDIDSGAMWETAIRRLGADPSALQTSHGVH
jgi:putative transcriptional regulator